MKNIPKYVVRMYDTGRFCLHCMNIHVYFFEYIWFDVFFPAIPPVIMNALEKKAFMKVNEFYIVKVFFGIFPPLLFTTSCALCHLVFAAIPSFKCSSSSGACGSVVSKGKTLMSLIQSCHLKRPSPSFFFFFLLAWCLQPLSAVLSSRKRGTEAVTLVCNVINSCVYLGITFHRLL